METKSVVLLLILLFSAILSPTIYFFNAKISENQKLIDEIDKLKSTMVNKTDEPTKQIIYNEIYGLTTVAKSYVFTVSMRNITFAVKISRGYVNVSIGKIETTDAKYITNSILEQEQNFLSIPNITSLTYTMEILETTTLVLTLCSPSSTIAEISIMS